MLEKKDIEIGGGVLIGTRERKGVNGRQDMITFHVYMYGILKIKKKINP